MSHQKGIERYKTNITCRKWVPLYAIPCEYFLSFLLFDWRGMYLA